VCARARALGAIVTQGRICHNPWRPDFKARQPWHLPQWHL